MFFLYIKNKCLRSYNWVLTVCSQGKWIIASIELLIANPKLHL